MAIVFGSGFKTIRGIKISTVDKDAAPKTLMWTKPTGNIGVFPSGYEYSYSFGVYDSNDAIDVFEVVSGQLPQTIQLNQFSGELEGSIPDVDAATRFPFTMRVRTTDNRHLYGDFHIGAEYSDLVMEWVTPAGSLGEFDLGSQVHSKLEAKTNK